MRLTRQKPESTKDPQATTLHAARGAEERTELVATWTVDPAAAFESPETKHRTLSFCHAIVTGSALHLLR